jgi:hypothetical protein
LTLSKNSPQASDWKNGPASSVGCTPTRLPMTVPQGIGDDMLVILVMRGLPRNEAVTVPKLDAVASTRCLAHASASESSAPVDGTEMPLMRIAALHAAVPLVKPTAERASAGHEVRVPLDDESKSSNRNDVSLLI